MTGSAITLPVDVARELTWSDEEDGWTVALNKKIKSHRWSSIHKLVIERDGLYYLAYYEQGLTEMQDWQPWEDKTEVEFVRCERQTRMVEVVEFVLTPGGAVPGQPGYVVGECGHQVAASEWRAGFRICERCQSAERDKDDKDGDTR